MDLDSYFLSGSGGSSLTVGGTLTNNSTDGNAIDIGYANISTGDTVTVGGLKNSGDISITGNGTIVSALNINGAGTNSATVNIDGSGIVQMGTGDIYTQAAGATNIALRRHARRDRRRHRRRRQSRSGGAVAGTANVTGGSLDGTGTVAGTLNDTSGGTVFAGPSIGTPGTLTVSGTYNQSGTGDLEANIGSGGTSSGVVADTGGFVNLNGGTLTVSSTPAVGSVSDGNDVRRRRPGRAICRGEGRVDDRRRNQRQSRRRHHAGGVLQQRQRQHRDRAGRERLAGDEL